MSRAAVVHAVDRITCHRKVLVKTKAIARTIQSRANREGRQLWFYECPNGKNHYHMTSIDPEIERRRRRGTHR